jgi:hypothetical protein
MAKALGYAVEHTYRFGSYLRTDAIAGEHGDFNVHNVANRERTFVSDYYELHRPSEPGKEGFPSWIHQIGKSVD